MASSAKTRSDKQAVITFTLPVSCQICLGKVKQPVLCPNFHVFCQLCLDTWLERHNKCPACRVAIGPDNPVKHIIGGQVEDENSSKLSTPDLRRARFDLLYKEYEEQFEKLYKESLILRTENNILLAQLKDAEKNNSKQNDPNSAGLSAQERPNLLLLTRNLQEIEKLYTDIKQDMSRLKEENNKLKDENMNLTRENENLRLEIAQRSPKKFGRYTVATLETKISEQEKEIRQLTSALECSDSYIENLKQQLEKAIKKGEDGGGGKSISKDQTSCDPARFQISFEPKKTSKDNFSFKNDHLLPENGAKRILFGKIVDDFGHQKNSHDVTYQQSSSSLTSSGSKLAQQQPFSKAESSSTNTYDPKHQQSHQQRHRLESHAELSFAKNLPLTNFHPGKQNSFPVFSTNGETVQHHHHKSDTAQKKTKCQRRDKTPQKVHFCIPDGSNKTSSFELEMPSPLERDSQSPINSSTSVIPDQTPDSSQESTFNDVKFSDFDQNIQSILKKNKSLTGDKTQTGHVFGELKMPDTKTSLKCKGKKNEKKTAKSSSQFPFQSKDSSHLSVPDSIEEREPNELDMCDNISDLNFSLTPELTDCLKLMNQAEKNIGAPQTSSSGIDAPFSMPCLSSALSHPAGSAQPFGSYGFVPSSNTFSSWEQQFFSSLKANPYRFNSITQSQTFSAPVIVEAPVKWITSSGERNNFLSSLDHNPIKEPVGKIDFCFSEPIKVAAAVTQSHRNHDFSHSLVLPTELTLKSASYNPFPLQLRIPSSSSSEIPTSTASNYSTVSSSSLSSQTSSLL